MKLPKIPKFAFLGSFFGFLLKLVTPIDLNLFTLVLYCSPLGFDRSHDYPATILNLTILTIFLDLGVPEPGVEIKKRQIIAPRKEKNQIC